MQIEDSETEFSLRTANGGSYRCTRSLSVSGCHWFVHEGEDRIARALTTIHEKCLKIGDLFVEDAPVVRGNCLRRLAIRIGVAEAKRGKSRRGLGIGSALLTEVLAWARSTGFAEVTGNISKDDMATFPGLIEWYERFGFVKVPPENSNFLAGIRLDLSSPV